MILQPLPAPSPFLSMLLITFIILIQYLQQPLYAQSSNYETCKNTLNCGGTIGTVGYPFYDGETRPQGCGYPGFNITCQGPATITIMSQAYYVEHINSTTHILTVAREDYFNNHCPASLDNIAINFTLFNYTPTDQNITFYYNCANPLTTGLSTPCNTASGTQITGYFLTESMLSSLPNGKTGCSSNLFVPVLESAIASGFTQATLDTALVQGFELEWFADNELCAGCTAGGGECGYDWTNNKFACYCPDGSSNCSVESSSTGSKKSSSKAGVAAGIAAGVIVIVAIILGGCYLRISRKKKKRLVAHAESKDISTPHSSSGLPSSDGAASTTKDFTTTTVTTNVNHSESIPSYPSSKSSLNKGSTYFGVQVFSYEELEEATNNFNESRELGDGGFGAVYYGELPDGRKVAVKRLYENSFKRVSQFLNEVEILAGLRHKNVVTLYGCTSKKSKGLLLVYEFIPNGTVADHLHGKLSKSGPLPWPVRLKIAGETAEALAHLHASDVIHRDVKTTNILLDNDFQVKVADFGLSRLFPTDATHVSTAPQGTPGYVDPEYFHLYRLTKKSDVYSFGVVLMELISSKPAVDTSRHRFDVNLASMAIDRIQNQALHELVDPCLGFDEDYIVQRTVASVAELAFQCLQQEKELRPSMVEVLQVLNGLQDHFSGSQKQSVMNIKDDDDAVLLNNGLLSHSPLTLYNNWRT
ncbi:hypothetical protein Dimus_034053 [Dionaea muscipula]